ncbi:GNAT family N-acetyltransferase [Macrococcus carouselicus]|uniref:GNAT family N-acetyltransferase n=1 Tax=Macrococcus carouselicus TaxID=69969 RepID=A0A9Q8CKW5_9STAP|nr:GNAT family N-acetyltransferase [Macrococcus carouselicus]
MEALIREIEVKDVQALQTISRETFRETFEADNSETHLMNHLKAAYNTQKLTDELENPDSFFYFAETKEGIAGYLKLNIRDAQSEDMGNRALEVERIYIRSAFHRQGIGQALMKKAYEVAAAKEKSRIWLGVWEHNAQAIAFYKKEGFQKTGEHVFMMGDDPQTDFIYEKELEC